MASLDRSKTYVLVPAEHLAELESRHCAEPLGPLAGPEAFPEPDARRLPSYGPAPRRMASTPRGFFLDRYIY